MAAGEHGHGVVDVIDDEDMAEGTVRTVSGRVSSAVEFREESRTEHPFNPVQLTRLDEALTLASRESGLRFSV